MPDWTEGEHDFLSGYVRSTADAMRLRDWDFVVRRAQLPVEEGAESTPTWGRRLGSIALSAGFRWFPPEVQRHYVVHELLHILTGDLLATTESGAELLVLERTIDDVAGALAPHLAPPDWPAVAISTPKEQWMERRA